ncbi:MAG TPA: N-formylglutamate amidohydrolase [Sphingomicrobium sp.]|nr:N-formylglutamate amidohydrolase [Sphingomicrobium sp.]
MESFDLAGPIIHPPRNALPVLLSVPHSGRDYPDWLDRLARHGRASLEPLEDPLVDRLAWRAIADGTGAVVARAPRAAVDCNRSEMELDPAVVGLPVAGKLGVRARGGLGIVPGRTIRHGLLWRRAISPAEFEARLDAAHRPFHAAVAAALAAIKDEQGGAVLLDCHSMPPRPNGHPNIVIGDRHGHSASQLISVAAERIAGDHGLSVQRNIPYAGGWIVERHGAPKANVHALQIEIDRRCYLGADLRSPGAGFDRISHFLAALVVELGQLLMANFAEAAE